MLENKLYLIEHKHIIKDTITYSIRQNKSNEIFKAHFPGSPITPGACLIEIAKELCEKHIGKQIQVVFVKSVKFINIITPIANEFLDFAINISQSENTYQAKVQILSEGNVYSKINFELA